MLEGFHAIKHAVRFGADVVGGRVDPRSSRRWRRARAGLAPALRARGGRRERSPASPLVPRTGSSRSPARPPGDLGAVLADPRPAPVVLLEDPRNMGNLGACVRVAAAAGAAGC